MDERYDRMTTGQLVGQVTARAAKPRMSASGDGGS